jgi:hypothetical protein
MIHRRQFLIETGASLGAWFLKQQLADRIIRVFQETGRPLLLDLEKPDYTFEVDSDTGIIRMVSEDAIELDWSSTWREFATVAGANPDCPDELKELCINYSYWSDDNEEEEPYEAPDLDDTVNDSWMDLTRPTVDLKPKLSTICANWISGPRFRRTPSTWAS